MIIGGAALLILGLVLGVQILYIIGAILLVLGIVFIFVRPGGRLYY